MNIKVLTSNNLTTNSRTILAPLFLETKKLSANNFHIEIIFEPSPHMFDTDLLIVESSYHGKKWTFLTEQILSEVQDWARRCQKLAYLDTSDSSALLHPEILPFVDVYFKCQILRDTKKYLKPHYGRRVYTDYIHEKFNIIDKEPSYSSPVENSNNLKKIMVFWNSAFYDWSIFGRLSDKLNSIYPSKFFLVKPKSKLPASVKKSLAISYRMNLEYGRETINWHRAEPLKLLSSRPRDFGSIQANRLGFFKYRKEIKHNQLIFSPFGWGEINYRDFETFQAQSTLIKPCMNHIETWPELYKENETYASYCWDLSNLSAVTETLLNDKAKAKAIAEAASHQYFSLISKQNYSDNLLEQLHRIKKKIFSP